MTRCKRCSHYDNSWPDCQCVCHWVTISPDRSSISDFGESGL